LFGIVSRGWYSFTVDFVSVHSMRGPGPALLLSSTSKAGIPSAAAGAMPRVPCVIVFKCALNLAPGDTNNPEKIYWA
jgi:hypothetical protein